MHHASILITKLECLKTDTEKVGDLVSEQMYKIPQLYIMTLPYFCHI